MTKPKTRTGPWSEDDYRAAGMARVNLRLSSDDKAQLAELAEMSGWSVSETVAQLTRAEKKRRESRASKKST
jgi:hypothetical protein